MNKQKFHIFSSESESDDNILKIFETETPEEKKRKKRSLNDPILTASKRRKLNESIAGSQTNPILLSTSSEKTENSPPKRKKIPIPKSLSEEKKMPPPKRKKPSLNYSISPLAEVSFFFVESTPLLLFCFLLCCF